MTALTKIDVPFGELDIETKLALHRAYYEGKEVEFNLYDGVFIVAKSPIWSGTCTYRIKPLPLTDIVLPWEAIDPQWKWAARDADGRVYLYKQEPDVAETYIQEWTSKMGVMGAQGFFVFSPGNKPWDESLIERPST